MSKKDTIYIDVDDDITTIIDRVKSSKEQIVALVLPKRASTLQSSVNMKLLKRSAEQSKKNPVLITSEPALMPLAAASQIHVAPNLQAAPAIPPMPDDEPEPEPEASEEVAMGPDTTVGDAMGKSKDKSQPDKPKRKPDKPSAKSAGGEGEKSGKPKVPNFRKFRKWMILGGAALVLLIGFLIWAIFFAPKATVAVKTETSDLAKTVDFTADTGADAIDLDGSVLPAVSKEIEKTDTEKVPATGQKDKGKKASGTVDLQNCAFGSGKTNIPSGTGISSGGLTYLTQKSVTLPADVLVGGKCQTKTVSVGVVAQESGEQYNVSSKSYSVSGHKDVVAVGSAMSGGTTNVVKVVSNADINGAKKVLEAKQEDATGELADALEEDGYVPIKESIDSNSEYAETPKAGTEASEATVVATVKHTMLGVKEDDFKELVKKSVEDDIDTATQTVLGFGLDQASFEIGDKPSESQTVISMKSTLVIGPDLKVDEIKSAIAGKSKDDAESVLKDRPGFSDSTVETKPFWVKNVPGNVDKIEVVVEKPDGTEITQ